MIVDSINAIIPGIIVLKLLDLHNKSAMNFCLCSVYLLNQLDPFEKENELLMTIQLQKW